MSLESAPDEIKLAVDLIMLLEQSDVAPAGGAGDRAPRL